MRKQLLFLVVLFFGLQIASAQNFTVTGKVTYADDGTPVVGAMITVKDTKTSTLSDVNGVYKIVIPSSVQEKVLVASYSGLESMKKPVVENNQVVNFALEQSVIQLETAQVIGYGSARKVGTVVGSVQQVTAKKLESRPQASVMDALQGQVAGLQIFTNDGEPSAIGSAVLHGVGSLTAGSAPLYVLDGIPISSETLRSLNSNDFESVTVLKDASATSIYGSRAANGVIYITTKRGTLGEKARINVSGQYGVSSTANRSFFDNMMSGDELKNFWLDNGQVTQAYIDDLNAKGYTHNTNWFDYYQRQNVPMYRGDISIQGGGGKTTYYTSASIYKQEGTAPSSAFNRITVNSNIESQANEWLRVGANIQLASENIKQNVAYNDNNVNGALSFLAPSFYSPYHKDGRPYEYWHEPIQGWNLYSPYYEAALRPKTTENWSTNSNAFLTIEPIKDLKITSRGGLNFLMKDYVSLRYPSYNAFLGNGSIYQTFTTDLTTTITNTIEYKFNIANDHAITALVGQEGISSNYKYFEGYAQGLTDDRLMNLNNGKASTVDVLSGNVKYAFLSFFGRLDYSFKDRIYVDASVRNDASSRFSARHRNATFWAVGAMWNMKKESFLEDNQTITGLTVRASFGTQGNSDFGQVGETALATRYLNNYTSQPTIGSIQKYNGQDSWAITNPGNENLTWETQEKFTVGATINLWNKLNIGVEYYNRQTRDMLMDVPIPMSTGFTEVLSNVGGLNNSGIDLNISFDILRGQDYFLSFSTVFNYNRMKITQLFDNKNEWIPASSSIGYVVGQPVVFYMPIYAGVNTQTGQQQWYLPGDDPNKTQMDPNKVTSDYDESALMQNTGITPFAPFSGGFSISGSWKGIGLQADFSYMIGKNAMVNERYFSENPNVFFGYNTSKNVLNSWKKPGDVAEYPNWKDGAAMEFDTHLISDASFMRLKNLQLSYTIPTKVWRNSKSLRGLKVYLTGRNLFTVTQFNGIDPEYNSSVTMAPLGNSRQYLVGLELTF